MSHIQYVDELVKEYLLFRGFSQTLKAFDNDLKAEKEKGFRVRIVSEQHYKYKERIQHRKTIECRIK